MQEAICKWQLTKGANCQWFKQGFPGNCTGLDARCAGKGVVQCHQLVVETAGCMWEADEFEVVGEITLRATPLRRLGNVNGEEQPGLQSAVKHGLAAVYPGVEPFEIRVAPKSSAQGGLIFSYTITTTYTVEAAMTPQGEIVKSINAELSRQGLGLRFLQAVVKSGTPVKKSHSFGLAATISYDQVSNASSPWACSIVLLLIAVQYF